MPTAPKMNGKIAQASAPQASCRPISERPVDVSRVAIMIAVFNRTIIETGKMSASDRMAKYDQYVTSMSPLIYKIVEDRLSIISSNLTSINYHLLTLKHRLCAKTLGLLYGSDTSHSIIGLQFGLFMYAFM